MSTDHAYESAIAALTTRIELILGWGSGLGWSSKDFAQLSGQIHERTGVQLSVVTLKRVWKKIEHTGKPTITTLNALAEFAGAQNWQQFKQQHSESSALEAARVPEKMEARQTPLSDDKRPRASRPRSKTLVWVILFACTAAVIFYVTAFRPSSTSRGRTFTFSSKKVVDTGVPNTVIFDYDASLCDEDDSVSIQQSWDPRLSSTVDPKLHQHTSIYYHPGYFDARLKVNGEVVQKHRLLIKSKGWLPLLDTKPMPVYFEQQTVLQDGRLGLPLSRIRETGIVLQPDPPWCNYYKVGDLPDIRSDDFVFEARVRNDFGEGAAACRYTEVHILFEGAAMVVPLSIPGCVSNLEFYDKSGKVSDLSPLGAALEDWVDVKFDVQDTLAQLYINHQKAFELTVRLEPVPWVGMIFKFKGTGSVDFIRVSRKNGEVVYEESFGDDPPIGSKALSLQSSY
ncbi:MAG TPA: hypothetical protein VK658_29450 [Chryseolinea sp.]|nr:hypothetical protein [Chryseolinea sp.]